MPVQSGAKQTLLLAAALLFLVGLTLVLQLPWTPRVWHLGGDSGLFAYCGQQIAAGKMLYLDCWDHKPPGVFYTDALALRLGGNSPWSLWWLAVVWISSAAAAFFLALRKPLGALPALLGSAVFLTLVHFPAYYSGGNFTEVYALLPQAVCLAALSGYAASKWAGWSFVLGLATALAFLYKPTYIALGAAGLAVIVLLHWRLGQTRQAWRGAALFGLGALALLVPVVAYFNRQGLAAELWYATFTYNFLYTQEALSNPSLFTTFRMLAILPPLGPVFVLSIAGLALFLWWKGPEGLFPSWNSPQQVEADGRAEQRKWVFAVVLLALPLELALLFISSRNFGHYFLTPLPVLSAGIVFLIDGIIRLGKGRETGRVTGRETSRGWQILSLALLVPLAAGTFLEILAWVKPEREALFQPLGGDYEIDDIEIYILENSRPDQSVLVWGLHPSINFITGRPSPTRYLYPLHLLMPPAAGRDTFQTFFEELEADPPVIVLSQPEASGGVPSLVEAFPCPGCAPQVRQNLERLQAYVAEHYEQGGIVGGWLVFRLTNAE